jgi:hypothetical protein
MGSMYAPFVAGTAKRTWKGNAVIALALLAGCNGGEVVLGTADPTLPPLAAGCGFDAPAFCETFETPHPGGRGGEIDESRWSFSRWDRTTSLWWTRATAQSFPDGMPPVATLCGQPFQGVLPPNDVRTCEGVGVDGTVSRQLHEVFDDQGDFALHSFMARQPFDFTGRTGKLVFDVDAKQNPYNQGHGWWNEVWITEAPGPLPHDEATGGVFTYPRRGIGIQFTRQGAELELPADGSWWGNAVGRVIVVDDDRVIHDYRYYDGFDDDGEEVNFRARDAALNHVEIRISQDRLEVWVSDVDDPGTTRRRAAVGNLDLGFSRGYVHLQHAQFDARIDGMPGCEAGVPGTCPTSSQTYRWDNIAFDGPRYPLLRAYDVADNAEIVGQETLPGRSEPEDVYRLGYFFTDEVGAYVFTLAGVDTEDARGALLDFNLYTRTGRQLDYRFNDGPTHTFTVPPGVAPEDDEVLRTFSVEVPLGELRSGDNTLSVQMAPPYGDIEAIGNLDLSLHE